jgi:hypothetical protein
LNFVDLILMKRVFFVLQKKKNKYWKFLIVIRFHRSQLLRMTTYYKAVIVIIRVMLSVYFSPKLITLHKWLPMFNFIYI